MYVFKFLNTSENQGKANQDMIYKAFNCAKDEYDKMFKKQRTQKF